MKPGSIVAFVDAKGYVHDAVVVSVINDGKQPTGALTLRTLDDDAERSNVQYADDRPAPNDPRVEHGHISAGHWRQPTAEEAKRFSANAARRAKTQQALAQVDESPKKGESPEETAKRVAAAKTKITSAATEPALPLDETPWAGETPEQTEQRIADGRAVPKKAAKK